MSTYFVPLFLMKQGFFGKCYKNNQNKLATLKKAMLYVLKANFKALSNKREQRFLIEYRLVQSRQ